MLKADLYPHSARQLLFQREAGLSALLSAWLFSILFFAQSVDAGNRVVVIPLGGEAPATSKLIFITNEKWKGNLGGVQGADDKCAAEAKSRGIKGRFEALLGTEEKSLAVRLNRYSLPYIRLDGEKLRSSYHSLFNGSLDNPVNHTAITEIAWTGLDVDGSFKTGTKNCTNWTSKFGTGRVGYATQRNTDWFSAANESCSQFKRLYCIEQ